MATGLGPGVTVAAGLGGSFAVGLAWATGLAVGLGVGFAWATGLGVGLAVGLAVTGGGACSFRRVPEITRSGSSILLIAISRSTGTP